MPAKHPAGHGRHKIFLGFAPGVGKTYAMLDEAHRRKNRGQDVVLGLVESHDREDVDELSKGFESIPALDGELDLQAIITRKPETVLIDALEHANALGSKNSRRWQDVDEILENGINVLSTLNVQHLESLNDNVSDITGVKVEETVPDRLLHEAEEVELVDLTPRALINRLERGVLFKGPVSPEVQGFFREGNLSALREIAMREAASHVDEDLVAYRKEKRIEKPWAAQDRVLICISPTRSSLRLIRRGWRMGQRMHGEVIAVYVDDGHMTEKQRKILDDDFKLAERLGIQTHTLKGPLAPTLINFAKERNVTQIILGHPERGRVQHMIRPSILSELARALRTVDIIVVATETASSAE